MELFSTLCATLHFKQRAISRCGFRAIVSMLAVSPVYAHPHVFIDATARFLFDDEERLEGIRVSWTYDAFASLMIFQQFDLDVDRDGKLDNADRATIVENLMQWPDYFDGNVHLDAAGVPVAMGRPTNGDAFFANDKVSVAFDLPLIEPKGVSGDMRLRLFDPEYYVTYRLTTIQNVSLAHCVARLDPFMLDAASQAAQVNLAALGPDETPSQDNVGALFADVAYLSCE